MNNITGGQTQALARTLGLGVILVLNCQIALAQAMYRIKPIVDPKGKHSVLYANGLNGAGEVTGTWQNVHHYNHAFLRKKYGYMVDLGPPEAGSASDGDLSTRPDWWPAGRRTARVCLLSYRRAMARP